MEKRFIDYNWDVFLTEKQKKKVVPLEGVFPRVVKNFSRRFSPRKGFFGLTQIVRDEESAISFLLKSGLTNSKDDAKFFLSNFFNNKSFRLGPDYSIFIGPIRDVGIELKKYSQNGETLYGTDIFWYALGGVD